MMASESLSIYSRRAALQLGAASLSLAACKPVKNQAMTHVAVIGAGIIGASIAYHLSKEGTKVTLLDQHDIATHASRGTFAWINATWAKQPRQYHKFNQSGLAGWKRLQSELGVPIRWEGSLEWFLSDERQAKLAQQIQEQAQWGEPAKMVGPNVLKVFEPHVDFGDIKNAAYSPNDGAVNPILATQTIVKAALSMGATLQTNCLVDGVKDMPNGMSKLLTSCGDLAVDHFVVATGASPDAPKVLAGIDMPQRSTAGVIVISKPKKRLINRIIVAPGVHIHQRDDGRIVFGEQEGAPKNEAHMERLRGRPNRFPNSAFAQQHASRILNVAQNYVPALADTEIEDVFIGWRPLPLDGHPVIGRSPSNPNAYLAIMHSGVTLSPIVGEVVAKEIITGSSAVELKNYRPDRQFKKIKLY